MLIDLLFICREEEGLSVTPWLFNFHSRPVIAPASLQGGPSNKRNLSLLILIGRFFFFKEGEKSVLDNRFREAAFSKKKKGGAVYILKRRPDFSIKIFPRPNVSMWIGLIKRAHANPMTGHSRQPAADASVTLNQKRPPDLLSALKVVLPAYMSPFCYLYKDSVVCYVFDELINKKSGNAAEILEVGALDNTNKLVDQDIFFFFCCFPCRSLMDEHFFFK